MREKMVVSGTVLRWGNSFGIRLKRKDLEDFNINENERVEIMIKKIENPLKDLWEWNPKKKLRRESVVEFRKGLSKYM